MRRPLVVVTAVYCLGLIMARLLLPLPPELMAGLGAIASLLVAALLFLLPRYFPRVPLMMVFLPLFLMLAMGNYQLTVRSFQGNLEQFSDERVALEGRVAAEPLVYADRTIYLLEVESVSTGEGGSQKQHSAWGRVRLVVEHALGDGKEGKGDPFLYGDTIRVRGRLTVPGGPRNPGGFDYKKFLLSQGAGGQLYVAPGQGEVLPPADSPGFKAAALRKVYAIKTRTIHYFSEFLPSHQAALLGGILFGHRLGLPLAIEENFRAAGVSHLLAVSGLHVGLVALLAIKLLRLFRIRGEGAYLWSLPILMIFALFTGFRPAVLRALLMFMALVVARALGRDRDFLSALALAAFLSLLVNPLFLFMPGFQLSYAGTLFIVYLFEKLKGIFGFLPSTLQGIAAVSLAAQLGVAPLAAYYFQQVSLVALVTNLLLVAGMTLVLGGGLLGALLLAIWPLAGGILLKLLQPFLTLFLLITAVLSDLPGAALQVRGGSVFLVVAYYGVFLLYLNKEVVKKAFLSVKGFPKKLVFTVLILSCLAAATSLATHIHNGHNLLEVTFLDVGQGASIFVRTPGGRSMLVDTGGALFPQSRDPGEDVLIPFFKYKGVKRLDFLFISHPHVDHYGGALALLEDNPPRTLVVGSLTGEAGYLELLRLAEQKGVHVYVAASGDRLLLERGIELRVHHPPREGTSGGTSTEENNHSLVLRLIYDDISFLFTGDIEEDTESHLVKGSHDLISTFLQVPHHGSGTSSTPAFLQKVSPRVAVIPVGANPFGHPGAEVLMRLKAQGAEVYRTDWHGAVTIKTDGANYFLETMLEGPALSGKG